LLPVALVLDFFVPPPPDGTGPYTEILDALVTTRIPAGTTLGFRFYPRDGTFLSASAASIVFTTLYDCIPGDFVRVLYASGGSGMGLQRLRYSCDTGDTPTRLLIGSTPVTFTPSEELQPYNVYLYAVLTSRCTAASTMVGLSAIAGVTDAQLPLPCVLSCKYAFVPNGLDSGAAVLVMSQWMPNPIDTRITFTDSWEAAWQWLKYGDWLVTGDGNYVSMVEQREQLMYVAPSPGALIPLAVKPHLAGDAWTAQVAFLVVVPIAAGTVLAISAQLPEGTAVPEPYWLWTAPATADVCPGTVLSFCSLSVNIAVNPSVNVGSVTAAPYIINYVGPDLDLTNFTVFSAHPCELANGGSLIFYCGEGNEPSVDIVQYVTALYTCSRPADCFLPRGLVAGLSMPAAPWADGPMVLPVSQTGKACVPVPAAAWRAKGIALANTTPVPWPCGVAPLPCFATGSLCCAPATCC
jgi:hypothetical protein